MPVPAQARMALEPPQVVQRVQLLQFARGLILNLQTEKTPDESERSRRPAEHHFSRTLFNLLFAISAFSKHSFP